MRCWLLCACAAQYAVFLTADAIARVQQHFSTLRGQGDRLIARFYDILFETHPELRPIFPHDLSALRAHFYDTLALVLDNLSRVTAVDTQLRDLGARHVVYGAQPQHYRIVRECLLQALAEVSGNGWNDVLAHDWRLAIATIMVPMLRGAAIEFANTAQEFASEDVIPGAVEPS